MQFIKTWWARTTLEGWTLRNSAVGVILGFGALVVLYIGLTVLGALARTALMGTSSGFGGGMGMSDFSSGYGEEVGYGYDMAGNVRSMAIDAARDVLGVSTTEKMIAPMAMESMIAPAPDYYVDDGGEDAEKYERRSYSSYVETRNVDTVCKDVAALKEYEYVLFDYANEYDGGCSYTFRVTLDHETEIKDMMRALDPRSFNASIDTVAQMVAHNESELAILNRQLVSYKSTLSEAEAAYAKVLTLATAKGDAGTLSSVITNKLNTIERLTQQIQSVQARIDRMTGNAEDTIDDTEYAHFSVSVSKRVFIDWRSIGETWKSELQAFAWEVNATIVALTLGLLTFALQALVFLVFAALIILGGVFVGKYVWKGVTTIWKWQ